MASILQIITMDRNVIVAAIVAVLAVIIIYFGVFAHPKTGRDGFVSQRAAEVFHVSRALFDSSGGAVTYSEFAAALADADPVIYSDARRLWREGKLTPSEVANIV